MIRVDFTSAAQSEFTELIGFYDRQGGAIASDFAAEVDFGADGRPLGIEVIDPISTTADELYGVFDTLGLRRPSPGALSPLTAA